MLLLLLLLCASVWATAPQVIRGPLPGSPLRGTINPDGYLKLLLWPNFNQPPSVYEGWCNGGRKVGDPSTAVFALRTNRCFSSNLGPGADLTNLAFNSVAGLFMAIQTNDTHFVTGMCQDAACQDCQFATRTLPSCVAGVITSSGGTQAPVVMRPTFQTDLPVLPSPLLCTRVRDNASGNCTGDVLVQGCVAQCTPLSVTEFAHGSCDPEGTGTILVTTCPADGGRGFLQCITQGCSTPSDGILPSTIDGCSLLDDSGYGYETVGCTITGSSLGLSAHPCGGLSQIPGVTCGADDSATLDGQRGYLVDGSYVPSNTVTTVRSATLARASVAITGSLAPNGALKLEYPTVTDVPIGQSIPIFDYSDPIAANSKGKTVFAAVQAVVLDNEAEELCAEADYGTTTLSVTVSRGKCSSSLSRGAIIGIGAGGGFILLAAAAAAVVGVIFFKRREDKFFKKTRTRTQDYVQMKDEKQSV